MDSTRLASHEEIARRAHKIWRDAGHPDGLASAHWLQAERELLAHDGAAGGQNSPRRKPAVQPAAKHGQGNAPHSTDNVHPGVTTDSLHHRRN
jgi:hypothetical protein